MKNFYATFLIGVLSLISFSEISAIGIEYTDEDDIPAWAESAIEVVAEKNIMTGFGDGSFGPDKTLNRAEAVTLLLRIKEIDKAEFTGDTDFKDVRYDAWYAQAVDAAVQNGWVEGFPDGTFGPEKTLNRAQWAVMLYRAFNFDEEYSAVEYDDVPDDTWFTAAVEALEDHGMFRPFNTSLKPEEEVSRAEAAWQIAVLLGETRVVGEIVESDYDLRRVAIKPRDFNANDQGYDIQINEIVLTAIEQEGAIQGEEEMIYPTLKKDDGWVDAGEISIMNHYPGRSDIDNITFRLRAEKSGMGPLENFTLRLENTTDGTKVEMPFGPTGKVFWILRKTLEPQENLVYKVSFRPEERVRFFDKNGQFNLFLSEATGRALKEISDPSAQNASIEIGARISIDQTRLLTFELDTDVDTEVDAE